MPTIAIATCLAMPALTPSDGLLANALRARGARVEATPWNGAGAPFADADLTIVRSTWDYFDAPAAFAAWIDCTARATRLVNGAALLRWNMTKAYLFDLAGKGAPVPPTVRTDPDGAAIAAAIEALDVEDAIVKPLCGGTASGLSRVGRADAKAATEAAQRLGGPGLVQPFLPEIETLGETSFIFLGGVYSHAVLKTPKAGDIRVQTEHGGRVSPVEPPRWAIEQAASILDLCPGAPAYARIDAIVFPSRIVLMEAELVEPELFFPYCPTGADRLAELVIDRLN